MRGTARYLNIPCVTGLTLGTLAVEMFIRVVFFVQVEVVGEGMAEEIILVPRTLILIMVLQNGVRMKTIAHFQVPRFRIPLEEILGAGAAQAVVVARVGPALEVVMMVGIGEVATPLIRVVTSGVEVASRGLGVKVAVAGEQEAMLVVAVVVVLLLAGVVIQVVVGVEALALVAGLVVA
ncbi:hypothetical protein BHM03_00044646 [Ensete ventricosum]|nr:hypothetical protein BHM03_00044646 [Ensete ventricosum]